MDFNNFLEIYNEKAFIESSTYSLYTKRPDILRVQVKKWKEKGYLLELKKGLYIFSQKYQRKSVSKLFIANYLVYPSYISLEYALGFYDIISERVSTVTSITTKKTNRFKNNISLFTYNSVKNSLFFGYEMKIIDNEKIFIAKPEKALLDYIYLSKDKLKTDRKGTDINDNFKFFKSLRLQNISDISISALRLYQKFYSNRIKILVNHLIEYIEIYRKSFKTVEMQKIEKPK